jgi:uncharacterized damage-inducible protein DinB
MNLLEHVRLLWEHTFDADARLLAAIEATEGDVPDVLREYTHLIAAEETWLARIEQRPPRTAVWPDVSLADVRALRTQTEAGYRAYLAGLRDENLSAAVPYANSAGQSFTNTVADILLHVLLHSQYHRGKVNLLLRQAGHTPAASDFIAFVRGVPAATEATTLRDATDTAT